jgi:hypothetical protein
MLYKLIFIYDEIDRQIKGNIIKNFSLFKKKNKILKINCKITVLRSSIRFD